MELTCSASCCFWIPLIMGGRFMDALREKRKESFFKKGKFLRKKWFQIVKKK
jgi:hypothetical protein